MVQGMDKIQKALNETLRSGERVLWQGGTEPFRLWDSREGKRSILLRALGVLLIGALAVAELTAESRQALILYGSLLLLAALIITPFQDRRALLSQRYFVTNERALLIRGNGETFAMELPAAAALYRPEPTGVTVALGEALLPEKDKQLRWRSLHPKIASDSGETVTEGLVFYQPGRAEEALRLLQRK